MYSVCPKVSSIATCIDCDQRVGRLDELPGVRATPKILMSIQGVVRRDRNRGQARCDWSWWGKENDSGWLL
jgi:hypothetical protein